MFPDLPQPKKEPYLTEEELFGTKSKPTGQPTGMAVQVLGGNATSERYLDPILEEINTKVDWSDELKAQKMAEVSKIQETARAREKEINREHMIEQAKNYGGAALEIGSAAIPGMLQSKVATQAIKMGKPLAEQIVKKTVKRGAVEGALSGAVEGLGRGIREDENILKTTAQDAVLGGVTGTALGKIAGETVAKTPKIKELDELLDKRKDWGIAFTKQSGQPADAIDKLLEQKQGFVPKAANKEGVGDIDFVWGDSGKGLQHIIERRNAEGIDGQRFVKDLPQSIKQSKVYSKKNHTDRIYVGNNQKEISIKTNYDKKPRNWLVSSYNLNKETPLQDLPGGRALEQTYASGQQISPLDLTKVSQSIIPPSQTSLNPSQSAIKSPLSYDEWLEELKRKRRNLGWW